MIVVKNYGEDELLAEVVVSDPEIPRVTHPAANKAGLDRDVLL